MTKKQLRTLGWLAAVLACGAWCSLGLAFAPKKAATELDRREFFKAELHISSSNVKFDEVQTSLANKAAWGGFFADYGDDFHVYFDPRSGTPSSIVGHIPMIPGRGVGNHLTLGDLQKDLGKPAPGVDAAVVGTVVRKFIDRNAAVLALDAGQLGDVRAEKVTDELWQVNFNQQVDGIPVRWGRLAATINNGNLVLLGTETWGNVQISTRPALTADEALQFGFHYAGGLRATDKLWMGPQLEILPLAPANLQNGEAYAGPIGQGYDHRLVWTFGFKREGDAGTWRMSVDAQTGEVLELKDTNEYMTKKVVGAIYPLTDTEICPDAQRCGTIQPDSPMPWANTGLAFPNDFTNSAGLYDGATGVLTTTLVGKYVKMIDTCGAVNETSATGDLDLGGVNGNHDCTVPAGHSAGDTAATRSAFYEVNKLMEAARGWLPNNTWLQSQIQTTVNLNATCNAYYSGGTINFYKSGGGCRNTGEIAAVFDHEWGHGLDYADAGGAPSNPSESYADISAIYRLQMSCIGYGFWWTSDQSCGMTKDGTGYNGDNAEVTGTHSCETDCSGVRGADWATHDDNGDGTADGVPDTVANFTCTKCDSGSGMCGREVHCDAMVASESAWDFAARDLQAAPFNYDNNTAFMLGNKLFLQGSGNIGNWSTCTCPSTSNGCGATNGYLQWLAADDDNGNLNDGTPHMTALYAAWNRHGLACATPAPVNSGCAAGPTATPTLTVAPGSNQVVLNWTPVTGAVNYWVLRTEGFAGCNFGKAVIATVPGTTYTDTQVRNGRAYYYNVVAVGASSACFSPASACIAATPQPCAGSISLNKSLYNCDDSVTISLVDSDLIGAGAQVVTLRSTTETTPENVTLTETPPASGIFSGTFPTTSTLPPVNGDGQLSVADGDTLTAKYVDVSYCGTANVVVEQSAPVDCVAPIITNVHSSDVTGNSARILWTTNEAANSGVRYGSTCPPGSDVGTPALVTDHNLVVSGLNECSQYYYSVDSTDAAGNVAADNNNGNCYNFKTGKNTNPTYTYSGPPAPIPDNNPDGTTATINVPFFDYLAKATVTVNITHSFDGDISLSLIAPDGTTVPLSTKRGSSGDNYTNTVFDDAATTAISAGTPPFTGSFRPESPLSVLNGKASYGDWKLLVVDSASADTGSIQNWSLTLYFPPAPCGAQVILDQSAYSCSSTVGITVKDTNVAGSTITVSGASVTEPGGETATLTRQPAPKDTWFQGTLQLTPNAVTPHDGNLSVVNADTITVTYIDADDGQGNTNVPVTATATTQCIGPVISNVFSSNVTGSGALINWTTDHAATSVVHYGLGTPPTQTASNSALVTTHGLQLLGLNPCSTYYFSVESVDAFGNVAVDNNNGHYYLFTTPQNTNANYTSTDTPIAIPDSNTTGVTSTINVLDPDRIIDLNVVVNITHTYDGDLALTLIAPNGTSISLANHRGSGGDNFTNTVFDDAATTAISSGTAPFTGSFKPETPLSVVNALSAAGAWKLKVVDSVGGDTGTLQNWSLQFTYEPRICGPSATYQSNTFTDSCSAGGPGSGNGVIERGEDVVLPVTIRNNGAVNLTGISAVLTTTTPGVIITRNSATYPDIVSGLTAQSNAPHFGFSVGPSVPCGADIAFNLAIQTGQGSFNSSFAVKVGKVATATNNYVSTDVPKPIPDNNASGATSTVAVTDTNLVVGVKVTVNITHSFDGDLALTLIGPNGTQVSLSNRRGSSGDNYTNTVFDDAATTPISSGTAPFTGSFTPESPLAVLNGIPANGTWSLKVADLASIDTGTITGWTLQLTTGAGWACVDCAPTAPTGEPIQQLWVGKTGQQWEGIAGATSYNLYRGVPGDLPKLLTADPDSCLRLNTAGPSTGAVLTELPMPGSFYWYLVRAANTVGEGPAGNATAGPRNQTSYGACP